MAERILIGRVKGEPGDPGVKGEPGAKGDAAKISIGNVITISPYAPARVVNTGSEDNVTLDFYIPQGYPGESSGDEADVFRPDNILWFDKHTGADKSLIDTEVAVNGIYNVNSDAIYTNTAFPSKDTASYLNVRSDSVLTLENCYLECEVRSRLQDLESKIKLYMRHCSTKNTNETWFPDGYGAENISPQTAISQIQAIVEYCKLSSLKDGMFFYRGFPGAVTRIYRNWIKGPGYLPDPSYHSDGIQSTRSNGYIDIIENRIEGYDDACIFISAGVEPDSYLPENPEPISHIRIMGNFFGNYGLRYYYIRIPYWYGRSAALLNPWNKRARYITITDNVFESHFEKIDTTKELSPLAVNGNTANGPDYSIFVRTEKERDEGVARQIAHPEVIQYRIDALGISNLYDPQDAADARTWIVWSNNIWLDTKEEASPGAFSWYDMDGERNAFSHDAFVETYFFDFDEILNWDLDPVWYRSHWNNSPEASGSISRRKNVLFDNGIMSLQISGNETDDSGNAVVDPADEWSGAEVKTKERNYEGVGFSYGLYEVSMKPIKNTGAISSFFVWTGPDDGNVNNEIDFEFPGKDTSKVFLAIHENGTQMEYTHDLGFDAAEGFHTYAFKWLPDSITWYVDGDEIHSAKAGEEGFHGEPISIPYLPMHIVMNVWTAKKGSANTEEWLGVFDGSIPLRAEYDWVRYSRYERVYD